MARWRGLEFFPNDPQTRSRHDQVRLALLGKRNLKWCGLQRAHLHD
jgi:hypothetical protein